MHRGQLTGSLSPAAKPPAPRAANRQLHCGQLGASFECLTPEPLRRPSRSPTTSSSVDLGSGRITKPDGGRVVRRRFHRGAMSCTTAELEAQGVRRLQTERRRAVERPWETGRLGQEYDPVNPYTRGKRLVIAELLELPRAQAGVRELLSHAYQ